MKSTVCSFFVALFAVLLIASCDSSTGPDNNREGTRVGSFMVYDTEAEWVGIQFKSKTADPSTHAEGDTLTFNQPDGIGVHIIKGKNNFTVGYSDSSYNATILDTTEASTNVEIKNPLWESGVILFGKGSDHISIETTITNIQCDSTYSPANDNLEIMMLTDSGEFHKAIHVNINGVVDAAKSLNGCS